MPYGEIYCLTCSVSGKKYIGQTTQTSEKRWKQHRNERNRKATHINRALVLHGVETFTMTVLDTADDQTELDLKEMAWIRREGTLSPNGYNLNEGGLGGGKRSPETRAKMSESQRNCVKYFSPEERERRAAAVRGKPMSPSNKAKLTEYSQNKSPEHREAIRKMNRERVFTPEMKAKMGASQTARWERWRAARDRDRAARDAAQTPNQSG